MSDAARRILLAILLLGVAGIIAELLLLGHTEDFYQLIPLVARDRDAGDERRRRAAAGRRDHPAVPGRDGAVHRSAALIGMCLHFQAQHGIPARDGPDAERLGAVPEIDPRQDAAGAGAGRDDPTGADWTSLYIQASGARHAAWEDIT